MTSTLSATRSAMSELSATSMSQLTPTGAQDGKSTTMSQSHTSTSSQPWFVPSTARVGIANSTAPCAACFNESTVVLRAATTEASATAGIGGVVRTFPLERQELLKADIVVTALRVDGGACWTSGDVTLDGRQNLTSRVTPGSSDYALQKSTVNLVIGAPSGGWVAGVGAYTDTELTLNATLVCATSAATSGSFFVLLVLPCPGAARPLMAEVKATVTAGQWVSGVGQGVTSSAIGRVSASRNLLLCGDGGQDGLLDIPAGCRGNDGTSGNLAIVACALVGASAVCVVLAVGSELGLTLPGLGAAARRVAFPSCVVPLLLTILPSTAGMSVVLLIDAATSPSCGGVSGGVGAAGLAVSAAAVVGMWYVHVWGGGAVVSYRVALEEGGGVAGCCGPWRWAWERWMGRRYHWKPASEAAATGGGERHAALVLQEYRALWFCALDTAVLFASGALIGVGQGVGRPAVCAACGIATASLFMLEMAVCVWARPFTSLFGDVYCSVTSGLSCTSVALQAASLLMQIDDSTDYVMLQRLATASNVCDLLVLGISVLRLVIDAADFLVMVCRLITCSAPPPTNIDAPPPKNVDSLPEKPLEVIFTDFSQAVEVGSEDLLNEERFSPQEVPRDDANADIDDAGADTESNVKGAQHNNVQLARTLSSLAGTHREILTAVDESTIHLNHILEIDLQPSGVEQPLNEIESQESEYLKRIESQQSLKRVGSLRL